MTQYLSPPAQESDITDHWPSESQQPTVSICCTTYNHEEYIRSALDSFLAQQTDFAFEILVHDDASTDNTAAIISEYETRYPNIIKPIYQSINQFSQGIRPNPAINYPRAKGEYIAVCEGDDYWISKDKLAIQVQLMRQYSGQVDITIAPGYMMNVDTNKKTLHCYYGNEIQIFDVNAVLRKGTQFAPTASYLFRRSSLDHFPSFFFNEPRPHGDFFTECLAGRKGLLYIPVCFSAYRKGTQYSYSKAMTTKQSAALMAHFDNIMHYTRQLSAVSEIRSESIDYRLALVCREYCGRFLDQGYFSEFKTIQKQYPIIINRKDRFIAIIAKSIILFKLARFPYKARNKFKSLLQSLNVE